MQKLDIEKGNQWIAYHLKNVEFKLNDKRLSVTELIALRLLKEAVENAFFAFNKYIDADFEVLKDVTVADCNNVRFLQITEEQFRLMYSKVRLLGTSPNDNINIYQVDGSVCLAVEHNNEIKIVFEEPIINNK